MRLEKSAEDFLTWSKTLRVEQKNLMKISCTENW